MARSKNFEVRIKWRGGLYVMLKTPLDRARVYVTALVRVRIRYFLSVAVFGRGIFNTRT